MMNSAEVENKERVYFLLLNKSLKIVHIKLLSITYYKPFLILQLYCSANHAVDPLKSDRAKM